MRTQNIAFRLTATIAVASLFVAQVLSRPVFAQLAPPAPANARSLQSGDPPARVGRLAEVNGAVSFHGEDETQWRQATLNYPVVGGDAFWTQPNAQARIEVSASLIAIASETELDVTSLSDTAFEATVPQGEVYLRLRAATPGETYAVQTPRSLVTLAAPGRYAIVAGSTQDPTLVTVLEGSAQLVGPGVALEVAANQTATITGTDTFAGQIGPAQPDVFLTAMLAREQPPGIRPAAVAAMPGGDDLALYGTWANTSDYGDVWYPQVAAGWVPYREGQWVYAAPWGWTWVDDDPWGFAPFHYGRWVEIDGRWGWLPGEDVGLVGPPVYAPALVTFFVVGPAVGIGIGAALAESRIGWCPLGPREVFHPWYRASPTYLRDVNFRRVTNVTDFATVNRNETISNFANRGGATMVATSAMTGSRPVAAAAQRVDPAQLARARPVFGTPMRPAATTLGVTPALARQLHLPAPTAYEHAVMPGPSIHSTQGGGSPPVVAAALHAGWPALRRPSPTTVPASAGVRPLVGLPALRPPQATTPVGSLPVRHEAGAVPSGVIPHAPGIQGPVVITHQAQPVPTGPSVVHTAPNAAALHIPPAMTMPSAHAPGVFGNPPQAVHPPAAVLSNPPQAVHPPPAVLSDPPQAFHPPPAVLSNPPQAIHPPPAAVSNQLQAFHPPPAVLSNPPQSIRPPPAVVSNQLQAFHPPPAVHPPPPVASPPPLLAHVQPPVLHAQPQVAHSPPQPPAQNEHKRPGQP